MNLDLGILWIEDSYDAEEEANLKRRVQEAGFIARIDTIPNGAEIDRLARDHQLYHRYDIILLDYRLQDENGNELAPRVRELFPYTTILFYSGSMVLSKLRQMIAAEEVEGVFCSERTGFIDRAGQLIDQTAQALNRLSGMRGLAMRVVAECDDIMKKAVVSMTARDAECVAKLADLDDDVLSHVSDVQQKYDSAKSGDIKDRLSTFAIDSSKLFKHFRRLTKVVAVNGAAFGLDAEKVERLRELRRASAEYEKNVLGKRNILGHVLEVQAESGWVLQGSNEIGTKDFADIRREFATQIDALREIAGLVTILDGQEAAKHLA
jgi:CheY-like chemotaxis protein